MLVGPKTGKNVHKKKHVYTFKLQLAIFFEIKILQSDWNFRLFVLFSNSPTIDTAKTV